jgi:hypothetical protein
VIREKGTLTGKRWLRRTIGRVVSLFDVDRLAIDPVFQSEAEVVQPSRLAGCNLTGVSPFIARDLPLPASVLWTAKNRRCVVRYQGTRSARQPLIEIVVDEHERVLKRKFFVDTLQAADFAVTEFNIATERVVQ